MRRKIRNRKLLILAETSDHVERVSTIGIHLPVTKINKIVIRGKNLETILERDPTASLIIRTGISVHTSKTPVVVVLLQPIRFEKVQAAVLDPLVKRRITRVISERLNRIPMLINKARRIIFTNQSHATNNISPLVLTLIENRVVILPYPVIQILKIDSTVTSNSKKKTYISNRRGRCESH